MGDRIQLTTALAVVATTLAWVGVAMQRHAGPVACLQFGAGLLLGISMVLCSLTVPPAEESPCDGRRSRSAAAGLQHS